MRSQSGYVRASEDQPDGEGNVPLPQSSSGSLTSIPRHLRNFQTRVQLDFAGLGPYPLTVLLQPTPAPFSHQSNINVSTGSSIPAFASRVPLSKDAPIFPSPAIRTYASSTPDAPEASHSASTSPASSVSPQALPDAHRPDLSRFYRQIRAQSGPLSSPTAMDQYNARKSMPRLSRQL